jgi:hypothetical protein
LAGYAKFLIYAGVPDCKEYGSTVGVGVNVVVGLGLEVAVFVGIDVLVGLGAEVAVFVGIDVLVGLGAEVAVFVGIDVLVGLAFGVSVASAVLLGTMIVGSTVAVFGTTVTRTLAVGGSGVGS